MDNQVFFKIWIIAIGVILIVGGIFAWQYFVEIPKGKLPEKIIEDETANLERKFLLRELSTGGTKPPVFIVFQTV